MHWQAEMKNWITRGVRSFAGGVLQLLYPNLCWACAKSIPDQPTGFCFECRLALITDNNETCPRCSSTIGPHTASPNGCTRCRDDSFAFNNAVRLGPYTGLLREVILRIKHGDEGLAEQMGRLWAEASFVRLSAFQPHLVVPVPLHWTRHWRRSFNQSQAFARTLAAKLRLPCKDWVRRIRATPPQANTLGAQARRDNVRGAFTLRRFASVRGKNVLLVDDVLTSGSTASEAARPLRKAGAKHIVVAVLGHGS